MKKKSIAIFSADPVLARFFELEAIAYGMDAECFSDITVDIRKYDAAVVNSETALDITDIYDCPAALVWGTSANKKRYVGNFSDAYYLQWPSDIDEVRDFYRRVHMSDLCEGESSSDKDKCESDIIYFFEEDKNTVIYRSTRIHLSEAELSVLRCLCGAEGQPVSREMLNGIFDSKGGNVADVYVHYLRKKLEEPFSRKLIFSVRGKGYRITAKMKKYRR